MPPEPNEVQELYNHQPDLEEVAAKTGDKPVERWRTVKQEQWELADLLEIRCSRPGMFFQGGSFAEGAAYINGFVMGRGGSVRNDLNQFNDWLAARAYARDRTARNLVWPHYVKQLCPDDERAFAELPALFAIFLSERKPTD